jgi:lysophospholipase L1-like esterase
MIHHRSAVCATLYAAVLAAVMVLCGCTSSDLRMSPGATTQNPQTTAAADDLTVPHRSNTPNALQITVIGDSFTSGTPYGGWGPKNWTNVLNHSLAGAGYDVYLRRSARGGSGYRHIGISGTTYQSEASREINPDTKMVVFVGSDSDADSVGGLYGAVVNTIDLAKEKAPGAPILVVGPGWCRPMPPSQDILATRDAVREASAATEVRFIDPIEDNWFDQNPELIAPDKVHPTDAGHQVIADRLFEPFIEALRSIQAPTTP